LATDDERVLVEVAVELDVVCSADRTGADD
jgi:hypothetical protein